MGLSVFSLGFLQLRTPLHQKHVMTFQVKFQLYIYLFRANEEERMFSRLKRWHYKPIEFHGVLTWHCGRPRVQSICASVGRGREAGAWKMVIEWGNSFRFVEFLSKKWAIVMWNVAGHHKDSTILGSTLFKSSFGNWRTLFYCYLQNLC